MTTHVIVDFDNTMGVEGFDTDDGLAFLYLLGFEDVVIDGICTTYGNSTLEVVHENTQAMLERMGLDIPLYKGGANPLDINNEASRFLAAAAKAASCEKKPLYVLATGSVTNLRGAHELDSQFYANLAGVHLMGGYTQSFPYHGSFIDELNFSCDPDAALDVLGASSIGRDGAQSGAQGCPIFIATAQACLPATFSRQQFANEFGASSWVVQACDSWFKNMEEHFEWPHAVCWDVVAAASLVQPELFVPATMDVTLYRRYLSVGYLEQAPEGAPKSTIYVPEIADAPQFVSEVFSAWHRGLARIGLG